MGHELGFFKTPCFTVCSYIGIVQTNLANKFSSSAHNKNRFTVYFGVRPAPRNVDINWAVHPRWLKSVLRMFVFFLTISSRTNPPLFSIISSSREGWWTFWKRLDESVFQCKGELMISVEVWTFFYQSEQALCRTNMANIWRGHIWNHRKGAHFFFFILGQVTSLSLMKVIL